MQTRLSFAQGDARTFRLGTKFDAVVSLFHVMSYMADDGDFAAALASARSHLDVGGVLLFDFWYGPAVQNDPPSQRERLIEEDGKRIRRITTPHWDPANNTVKITFDVEVTDVASGEVANSSEVHKMRYFFDEDIKASLSTAGFECLEIREWLTLQIAGPRSFGVYALARAL